MTQVKDFFEGNIGRRLVIFTVLFGVLISLISTAAQLALDYRTDINRIYTQLEEIQFAYLDSLATSVWFFDDKLIQIQLDGLRRLPNVEYLSVNVSGEAGWTSGEPLSKHRMPEVYPLIYTYPSGEKLEVGELTVMVGIDDVYGRLFDKAVFILISNTVKIFLIAGFILLFFWKWVTRHLRHLADYTRDFDLNHLDVPLRFERSRTRGKTQDEFDHVATAVNLMRRKISESYGELEESRDQFKMQTEELGAAQEKLKQVLVEREAFLESEQVLKENLEELVTERTQELQNRTQDLENSLDELGATQKQLVESEKMAALGSLVAGIAHEINTPIGNCLTMVTFQQEKREILEGKLEAETMSRSELVSYLGKEREISDIVERNINRASELISSFKMIAVDQSHDEKKNFNLKKYIKSSVVTLKPNFHNKKINFKFDIPGDLSVNSYPGLYHQVLSNLMINSVLHGFRDMVEGDISIKAFSDDGLQIIYCDNGCGLNDESIKRVFEPFYTTSRSDGGSGLGMSIVFNIVTNQLQGKISVVSHEGQAGACFHIILPVDTPVLSLINEQALQG